MSTVDIAIIVVGALLFLAIGSFTCVIIDRLPLYLEEPNQYNEHWETRPWGEVLGGTSRCSDCGIDVRPQDNIPILSFLILRGKCRGCGNPIPRYHPFVELLSPLLFLLTVWGMGLNVWIIPVLWLIPAGIAISAIDFRAFIVPTRVVWPATAVAAAMMIVLALVEGQPMRLANALIGVVCFAGPLFAIWFMVPKNMGFGDVRLATMLGLYLGFYAGTQPMAAVTFALFGLAAASFLGLAIGIIVLGARGRKTNVPYGPSLVLATYLFVVFAEPILEPFGTYVVN